MKRRRGNFRLFDGFCNYVPGVPALIILCVWFGVGVVLSSAVTLLCTYLLGREATVEYSTVISYPLMFLPAMIWAASRSARATLSTPGLPVDRGGFGSMGGFRWALYAVVCMVCLSYVCDAITAVLPPMPDSLKQALDAMTSGNLWLNLLCVSVFAPIFEEWLCRGTILRGLLGNRVPAVWAIIVSALFFALIHGNIWQGLSAFVIGLMFGFVYWKTGSLKLTMLMHCVNNTLSVLLSRIDAFANAETWKDVLPMPVYIAVLAACVAGVVLCMIAFCRQKAQSFEPQAEVC